MIKMRLRLLLVFLMLSAINAFAIDLQPGDIVAPRPGFTGLQLSYQYSEKNDYYSHGQKNPAYPAVTQTSYLTRLGHSFELAEKPAYFYAQVPVGAIHPQGYTGDSGVGDISLAFAVWPYANRETKTYIGVAGYLVLPTGSYDANRSFNMGENRYKTALQAGYQTPLLDQLSCSVAVDAMWFGDNTDYGSTHKKLTQDALYTAQFGLRYDFNPQYSLTANYFYTVGGETTLNGVDKGDITQLQRYQLSGVAHFSFGRIILQYGGDIKTENGYFEDQRVILRYTAIF